MKILYATMEVAPFSKVGGLGDVAKSLSYALMLQDVPVTIITPWYRTLPGKATELRNMRTLRQTTLQLGALLVSVTFKTMAEPIPGVELIFVDEPRFLSRDGPYITGGYSPDYAQEPQASIAFCKAIVDWYANSGETYHVVHLNEHHTALAAGLLRQLPTPPPVVLTVHNFGHQGVYDAAVLPQLGLPAEWFYPCGPLEFYGKVNFLKVGVWCSDAITTVSESYRQEVMSQYEYGLGLEGLMRTKADRFLGILNGIEVDEWNPRSSPHISPHYSDTRMAGKLKVKIRLLEELGLSPESVGLPLVAVILRLVEQKGIDLILEVAEQLLAQPALLVVMGKGKEQYERAFESLEARYPDHCRAEIGYEEGLAHRITAGADVLLMPSRFEPCGLNQMYALAFGTIPVVRHTGGLADTVIDVRRHKEAGTGFTFRDPTPEALWRAVSAALVAYRDLALWRPMMRRAMREDYSWEASARRYIHVYESVLDGSRPQAA